MFLRLTQKLSGPVRQREVWVQSAHIVAMYPEDSGGGCLVELTTSTSDDAMLLRVAQGADQIAQSLGSWLGFEQVPKILDSAPKEADHG
jgi:hypothetical protein